MHDIQSFGRDTWNVRNMQDWLFSREISAAIGPLVKITALIQFIKTVKREGNGVSTVEAPIKCGGNDDITVAGKSPHPRFSFSHCSL